MEGVRDGFLASIPGSDAYFSPDVERCDNSGVDITLHSCPLLEAWQEAGIAEDDIAEIAGVIDNISFLGLDRVDNLLKLHI
ncbi:MAG: L-2-amino-thiazoline-4-carboxylic acid hydrolase [Rhodospirillales bacterium]|nr:L-2-amino-thiazoline-4-carboxylic acid hydrolase [Rhodospirillales bacterium]